MSDQEIESAIRKFLSGIGIKIKLILAGIGAALAFVFIVMFRSRMNNVKMLEYELKKVRSEIEIEKAQLDIDGNNALIDDLIRREEGIKRKIFDIENIEPSKNPSREELDNFFDERGF